MDKWIRVRIENAVRSDIASPEGTSPTAIELDIESVAQTHLARVSKHSNDKS